MAQRIRLDGCPQRHEARAVLVLERARKRNLVEACDLAALEEHTRLEAVKTGGRITRSIGRGLELAYSAEANLLDGRGRPQ